MISDRAYRIAIIGLGAWAFLFFAGSIGLVVLPLGRWMEAHLGYFVPALLVYGAAGFTCWVIALRHVLFRPNPLVGNRFGWALLLFVLNLLGGLWFVLYYARADRKH